MKHGNAQVTYIKKPRLKLTSFCNHSYPIYTWSDNTSTGTIVNRALLSLHGGLLEITFSFKISKINLKLIKNDFGWYSSGPVYKLLWQYNIAWVSIHSKIRFKRIPLPSRRIPPLKKIKFSNYFFLRNLLEASLECNNCCNLYSRNQAEYNFKHFAFYNYSLMVKCISNKFICYSAYFVMQLVS